METQSKLESGLILCAGMVLLAWLTACAGASSSPVVIAPEVVQYAPEVQALAADELDSLPPPCPADAVVPGCSAVKRLIIDYKYMRDQARALQP